MASMLLIKPQGSGFLLLVLRARFPFPFLLSSKAYIIIFSSNQLSYSANLIFHIKQGLLKAYGGRVYVAIFPYEAGWLSSDPKTGWIKA